MLIRRATEDDRLALFKLCVAMHAETDFRNYSLNPTKIINNLGGWIHGDRCAMFVAVDADDIAGFFAAKLTEPWFSDDLCSVEDCFYVKPERRGSRAGYMLTKAWIEWGESHGALHRRAGVSSGSGPAGERLYEHFGMKNMGGNWVAHSEHCDRSEN